MKTRLFVLFLAVVLGGCGLLSGPSDVTSFTPRSVSPAPGSVLTAGTTITIRGPLSVESGVNYTMLYVRNDGAVFLSGMSGHTGSASWPDYRFTQGVGTSDQHGQVFANSFCYGSRTVTQAVFVTSTTDLGLYYLNSPQFLVIRDFDWSLVDYRVDIPLNYRCW